MKRIIGLALILSPFAVMTGLMVADMGVVNALLTWGAVAIVYSVVGAGFYLVAADD